MACRTAHAAARQLPTALIVDKTCRRRARNCTGSVQAWPRLSGRIAFVLGDRRRGNSPWRRGGPEPCLEPTDLVLERAVAARHVSPFCRCHDLAPATRARCRLGRRPVAVDIRGRSPRAAGLSHLDRPFPPRSPQRTALLGAPEVRTISARVRRVRRVNERIRQTAGSRACGRPGK